jgi:hypothetical protein
VTIKGQTYCSIRTQFPDFPGLTQIPGYPGYYAKENGDIYASRRSYMPKLLHYYLSPKGYHVVDLYNNWQRKTVTVHKLIMLTFIGSRPDGLNEIRHLDGNKANNHLSNLKYGTSQDNADDKKLHGTCYKSFAKCHPDRPLVGNGLCNYCYQKQWALQNIEKVRESKRAYQLRRKQLA